jgi:hypothetical protein
MNTFDRILRGARHDAPRRAGRMSIAMLLLLTLLPHLSNAQTTFTVTVVSKDASHPNPNAHPEVFAIDGVQGKELTLTRGTAYIFMMNNTPPIHPFYISTSSTGAGSGIYSDGVTGNFATGNGMLMFTPGASAPDLLYYQCAAHPDMGWRINIVGAASGVDDDLGLAAGALLSEAAPNPFSSSARFTLTVPRDQRVRVALYDATGCEVATLHDGLLHAGEPRTFTLDGAGLPAGVYEISAVGATFRTGRRAVLVR